MMLTTKSHSEGHAPRYTIAQVSVSDQLVRVNTTIPPERLQGWGLYHPMFPKHRHGIDVTVLPGARNGSQYEVSFRNLQPETYAPPMYPSWRDDAFVLPIWSLLLVPGPDHSEPVEVGLSGDVTGASHVCLVCPQGSVPLREVLGFCVVGGFSASIVEVSGASVTLHMRQPGLHHNLRELTRRVLGAHYRFFNDWIWSEIHLLYEEQHPRLAKQKGMLSSSNGLALGRYVFQSLEPEEPLERLTQMDLIEHEILHYYIDTTAPAGSWLVEGLTTYLSRRVLYLAGLLGEDDWNLLVKTALIECKDNPLCHKVSLGSARSEFLDRRYANVIYNKGFLISYLLDREMGGDLLALGQELFEGHGKLGRQFTEEHFMTKLPLSARRKLETWLDQKGFYAAFRKIEDKAD